MQLYFAIEKRQEELATDAAQPHCRELGRQRLRFRFGQLYPRPLRPSSTNTTIRMERFKRSKFRRWISALSRRPNWPRRFVRRSTIWTRIRRCTSSRRFDCRFRFNDIRPDCSLFRRDSRHCRCSSTRIRSRRTFTRCCIPAS